MFREGHIMYSGDNAVKLNFKNGAVAEFAMNAQTHQRFPELSYNSDIKVQLHLPRFSIEQLIKIQSLLTAAGLVDINGPDYQNMMANNVSVSVSEMRHKIYCRFDEHGAEVKALTYFAMSLPNINMQLDPVKIIRFDRPFHFRITKSGQTVVDGFYNGGSSASGTSNLLTY